MVKERLVLRKEIKKLLYTIIIFLIGMILVKDNSNMKEKINTILYKESPNYMKAKKVYTKYFGDVFNTNETKQVFSEKITYNSSEKYKNGVKLNVGENYLVPTLESGIIIFMENNKVIISQVNGINVEYSNINVSKYKMYDYIEKGKPLGEVVSKELILSFEKDGKYLDYKEYI